MIWASDWPVCNINYPGNEVRRSNLSHVIRNADAWCAWVGLTDLMLVKLVEEEKINEEDIPGVWGGNGARVYGIGYER